MKLEDTFDVPAPPERVWEFMLDLGRVTPCMPGAELEELPDENTWKGRVSVKLGAVSLSYTATAVIDERDERRRRVVIKANGRETRGKGTAAATIDSHLEPMDAAGTRVVMNTDLTISGAAAQLGRGMIADVSKRLTGQFAECLQTRIAAPAATEDSGREPAAAAASTPIGGVRLGLWALFRAIGRLFKRMADAVRGLFSRR